MAGHLLQGWLRTSNPCCGTASACCLCPPGPACLSALPASLLTLSVLSLWGVHSWEGASVPRSSHKITLSERLGNKMRVRISPNSPHWGGDTLRRPRFYVIPPHPGKSSP